MRRQTETENKDKVSLVFDQLYINNHIYVWSNENNDKIPLKKAHVEAGLETALTAKATNIPGNQTKKEAATRRAAKLAG